MKVLVLAAAMVAMTATATPITHDTMDRSYSNMTWGEARSLVRVECKKLDKTLNEASVVQTTSEYFGIKHISFRCDY